MGALKYNRWVSADAVPEEGAIVGCVQRLAVTLDHGRVAHGSMNEEHEVAWEVHVEVSSGRNDFYDMGAMICSVLEVEKHSVLDGFDFLQEGNALTSHHEEVNLGESEEEILVTRVNEAACSTVLGTFPGLHRSPSVTFAF